MRKFGLFLILLALLTGCSPEDTDTPTQDEPEPTPTQQTDDDRQPDEHEDEDGGGYLSDYSPQQREYIYACQAYLEVDAPEAAARIDYNRTQLREITEHEVLTAFFLTEEPERVDESCIVVILTTAEEDFTFQGIVDAQTGELLAYISDV